MNSVAENRRFKISIENLKERFNNHSDVENPRLFKSGVIDVQLLIDAEMTLPEVLKTTPTVGVRFETITYNRVMNRKEPVFSVTDVNGEFVGHYFSSAFQSLAV